MLSADRIGAPQLGHRERGRIIDSPAGTRWIAAVMKLPNAHPSTRAITMGNQLTAMNLRLDGVDGYTTSRMYDTSSVNPVTSAPGITIGL